MVVRDRREGRGVMSALSVPLFEIFCCPCASLPLPCTFEKCESIVGSLWRQGRLQWNMN
jgi:hypothetical protein